MGVSGLRWLYTGLCYKIDWASLFLEGSQRATVMFLVLCCMLYLRAVFKFKPPGTYIPKGIVFFI